MKTSNTINLISKTVITIALLSQLAACNFLITETGLTGESRQRNVAVVEVEQKAETETVAVTEETDIVADKPDAIVAAEYVLNWTAPSMRENNTAISMAEITGYRIYYGTKQGEYPQYIEINDAYADEFDLSNFELKAGKNYFVLTTIDTNGRESAFSKDIIIEV